MEPITNAETATDPVCGMVVNVAEATAKGLTAEHDGQAYYFCGKGCQLDFFDDPRPYFDPDYQPQM